jgi:formylglycine-generating enzyme required for sulfatase activity
MTESSVAPWGDEFTPGGKHMANTWQGDFPHQNLATDGSGRHWFLYSVSMRRPRLTSTGVGPLQDIEKIK